jgi:SAM-dependent methyltransferase
MSITSYSAGSTAYDRMMRPWSQVYVPKLLQAVGIGPGQRVLDVATGTGVAALLAADRVGPSGRVVGVDISLPMLRVAQPKVASEQIAWLAMDGQALALREGTFEAVTCQLGLMFFPDPQRGLAEFRRVLRPPGRVGLAVLSRPEGFPYGIVFEALARRVPSERRALLLGFSLGDRDLLEELSAAAPVTVSARPCARRAFRWNSSPGSTETWSGRHLVAAGSRWWSTVRRIARRTRIRKRRPSTAPRVRAP